MERIRTSLTPTVNGCMHRDDKIGRCRRRPIIGDFRTSKAYCIDHAYKAHPDVENRKVWLEGITVLILRRSYNEKKRRALLRFSRRLIGIALKQERQRYE